MPGIGEWPTAAPTGEPTENIREQEPVTLEGLFAAIDGLREQRSLLPMPEQGVSDLNEEIKKLAKLAATEIIERDGLSISSPTPGLLSNVQRVKGDEGARRDVRNALDSVVDAIPETKTYPEIIFYLRHFLVKELIKLSSSSYLEVVQELQRAQRKKAEGETEWGLGSIDEYIAQKEARVKERAKTLPSEAADILRTIGYF